MDFIHGNFARVGREDGAALLGAAEDGPKVLDDVGDEVANDCSSIVVRQ